MAHCKRGGRAFQFSLEGDHEGRDGAKPDAKDHCGSNFAAPFAPFAPFAVAFSADARRTESRAIACSLSYVGANLVFALCCASEMRANTR
ncbi:MAG: hypothetical protein WBD40_20880, partial [Tepidisphaeraceae bacterium]